MLILLGSLACASILAPLLIHWLGRSAFALLAAVPAVGFFWLLQHFVHGTFAGEGTLEYSLVWVPEIQLILDFRLDALSGLFGLIITGVGALVMLYCWGYFDSTPRRLALFAGQMMAFATVMIGLVSSDNFLLLYIFWEATSILSFLLVSYYGERASSRRAAGQALMVTVLGGLIMLVGIVLLGQTTGTWSFSELSAFAASAELTDVPHIGISIVLVIVGALSKSAIAPFHFWLPGAMAAPTPVSAYLHSAAMVKAGIYLVARLAPDFAQVATWHALIIPLALFTMLLGGWMALKQRDLKLILAYGTVSQLGFITSVVAIGSREALLAGLALTVAHSLFKATLFMVVGAIDHSTGTRDIFDLSGLGRKQPLLAIIAILAAASMAGVIPMLGFVAKEAALEAVLHEELLVGTPRQLILVFIVVGSVLTVAYSIRVIYGAFASKKPTHPTGGGICQEVATMAPISVLLWGPPAILVALTIFFGLQPGIISNAINQHLDSEFAHLAATGHGDPAAGHATDLALWHGWTLPLAISAGILAVGGILHWQRRALAKAHFDYPALGNANDAYYAILNQLRRISLRLTASTQRGSLQYNLGVIFAVLAVVPLIALLLGDRTNIRLNLGESAWQAGAAIAIIAAAIAATVMHNRLSAVVLVGVTGYFLAFIFAMYGAPDLALTQVLVETVLMVIFMLVLRKMPTNVEWRGTPQFNRFRAWLSIAVAFSVVTVALFAMNARTAPAISEPMPKLAEEISHGLNTVNVILVDFRAWDTMGETIVLIIASLGVASLIYRTNSFTRRSRRPILTAVSRRWLAAQVETERAANRSIMVDVATRVLFPSMMALSVYFFFAGHNAPGGGFAGGLVAALALTLRYVAGGRAELEETLPVDPARLFFVGLMLSTGSALVPMAFGDPPLTSYYASVDVPVIGAVSLPSALIFDAAVYLIVIGMTMYVLTALGTQLDLEEEERKQRARDRAKNLQHKNLQRKNLQRRNEQKAAKRKQQKARAEQNQQAGTETPTTARTTSGERSRS